MNSALSKILAEYFTAQGNILDAKYKASPIHDHQPDTGSNREIILKDWLDHHLPASVKAHIGGEIIDSDGGISRQIDIIIYDSTQPVLGDNPKRYYFAEGTVAAISVKSKLNGRQLNEAFKNIGSAKIRKKNYQTGSVSHGKFRHAPLCGIFAYESSYSSPASLLKALSLTRSKFTTGPDFILINNWAFYYYNDGKQDYVDIEDNKIALPTGYFLLDQDPCLLWRLYILLADEARKVINGRFEMQKYFQ